MNEYENYEKTYECKMAQWDKAIVKVSNFNVFLVFFVRISVSISRDSTGQQFFTAFLISDLGLT